MFKFINSSANLVVLKSNQGKVAIYPGKHFTTPDKHVARELEKVPELTLVLGDSQKKKNRRPLKKSFKKKKQEEKKRINKYFSFSVKPSISIIILNKNSPEIIIPCVNSIIKQVKYPNVKITIGDTGSKDSRVLKFYESLEGMKTREIKIIRGMKFHFGKNYNELIKKADTDYVLLLNSDTLAKNDFVTHMMRYIQNNKVGSVGAQLLYPNGTIQHVGQCLYNTAGHLVGGPGHYHLGRDPTQLKLKNGFVDGVTAACMLINRDLFLDIEGFDEKFVDIFQDVDFNLRMRKRGYKAFQCNDAVLIHHDNYTRRRELNMVKTTSQDDARYRKKWIQKGKPPVSVVKERKPKVTFLTPVVDNKNYLEFTRSIDPGDNEYEFIFSRNGSDEAGMTYPQVMNILNDLAEGEYVIMCHEDIVLSAKWIDRLVSMIELVEKKDKNWGLIGIVGIGYRDNITLGISFLDDDLNNWFRLRGEEIVKCDGVLDEVCMVSKRGTCKFDESFDGFHFYGADISLTKRLKDGKTIYVINNPLEHKSKDGTKHLNDDKNWNEYRRLAIKLANKWKTVDFATTTVVIKGPMIEYWLAPRLKRPKFERIPGRGG